ncbi:MAG: 30S ribosomal protein S1 [Chlamydiota bacterium]
MTNQSQDWSNVSNILDDEAFLPGEVEEFKHLLDGDKKQEESSINMMKPGEILKGIIVEIVKDFVIVDVGLKSEGLVPVAEFTDSDELSLGNEIEVYLDRTEGEDGQIVLSKEKARKQRQWEYIVTHCKEGSLITGKVIRKVKGGLMVDIGMEAFLPGSQIDNKRIKNLDEFIGKTYEFKILKINIERKNIVVSRRELLEEERVSKKAEVLETIHEGDLCTGTVKNITDFGVFLDLNGIDGLLHITDMTWKRIKHPSEMISLGDTLEVIILHVDKEKGRVALGLKQKDANPWEEIEKRYPPGKRVRGKIVNLVSYGAFIEIEPGIEGLIHVSEMSWTKNITDPSEIVEMNQEVEALVLSVQKEDGKISLGIKQTQHNPWEDVEEKYPIGKSVTAEIRNLTNYGAFVELEPGVEGLIHISDLSWSKKISHPSEVFQKGERVDMVILSVDRDSKKITLGVKQLGQNPWDDIQATLPIGSLVKGVVTKTTAFGAFILLDNGIEALIHVSELSDQPFGKVEEIVKEGDHVTAKIIKLDSERKKISLSIKDYIIEKNKVNHDDILIGQQKNSEEDDTASHDQEPSEPNE